MEIGNYINKRIVLRGENMNKEKVIEIINELSYILEELEARNCSNNCVVAKLIGKSWSELCDYGTKLFEQLKK